MQETQSIFSFYVRVSMWLALVCTALVGAIPALGYGSPRRVIAFVGMADRVPNLHLMDVQRGISQPISDVPIYSCCLNWSPDGTAIVFGADNNRVYSMDIYGGETHPLSPPDWRGWAFGWADGGRQVILSTMSLSNGSLYRVDANGDHFELLADSATDRIYLPLLSPDGHFAFYAERQSNTIDWTLNRLKIDDGTESLFIDEGWDGSQVLAFSPDSQRAAYALPQRRELLLMNTDGSRPQHIPVTDDILEMAWSSDSQRLLLLTQGTGGLRDVHVIDADGQNRRKLGLKGKLLTMSGLSWSPDGTQILFTAYASAAVYKPDVYVMDADGQHIQQLTTNSEADNFPAWQPDPM